MKITRHPGGLFVRLPGNYFVGGLLIVFGLLAGFFMLDDFGNLTTGQQGMNEAITLGFLLGGIWVVLPVTIVVGIREGVLQIRRGLGTVYYKRNYLLADIQKLMAESATGKVAIIFTSKPMKRIATARPQSDAQKAVTMINEILRNAWLQSRGAGADPAAAAAAQPKKPAQKNPSTRRERKARRLPD